MHRSISIKLLDFLLSLSESLDLFSPLLAQHQTRTAFIAWKIGEKVQLSPSSIEHIITAALLHDIGALSPEDKIALHENEYEKDIHIHCIYGENLLNQSPLFEQPSKIVRYHHTSWQSWDQSTASQLALQSQILFLADTVERAIDRDKYILHQSQEITEQISSLSGSDFHPDLVEAYKSVASREEFWFDLVSLSVTDLLREGSPSRNTLIFQSDFLEISEVLRNIIDFRSHFTATHSTGVSSAAAIISRIMGYSEIEVEMMQLVGNLHDVGKLTVSNSILEKPKKLTGEEFAIIRQHTYHTYSLLRRCGLPQNIVEWAGFHHEKLNGAGYPFHLNSNQINSGSRIVAVADVLIALAEDRPYRKGMSRDGVLSIIDDMAQAEHLDPFIVEVLKKNYDEIVEPTFLKQQAATEQYLEGADITKSIG